ncbi:MAG: 3-deoxy-manno-octulosonate cytidylyltransferase [Calditrichaeota bacterium]|nr:MAG: 3-deoxy-manno-octulosonate cytidylyltransferase [Calditrichota bacterium]
MKPRVVIVIPARFGSQRLPGKPLRQVAGRPLIEWVWRRAQKIQPQDRLLVATDHAEIARVVEQAGGESVLTPEHLANGTERVAWVARQLDAELVVNVQGDEPLVDVSAVSRLIRFMQEETTWPVGTLAAPLKSESEWTSSSVTKVLLNRQKQALLFSRRPLPFFRSTPFKPLKSVARHVGVYVYRREVLLQFPLWPVSELEEAEQLEQLRFLHQGVPMYVQADANPSPGIDTEDDLRQLNSRLTKQGTIL